MKIEVTRIYDHDDYILDAESIEEEHMLYLIHNRYPQHVGGWSPVDGEKYRYARITLKGLNFSVPTQGVLTKEPKS